MLDSPRPTLPFRDYAYNEMRYTSLAQTRPDGLRGGCWTRHRRRSWRNTGRYEEMAGWSASRFHPAGLQSAVQNVPVAATT